MADTDLHQPTLQLSHNLSHCFSPPLQTFPLFFSDVCSGWSLVQSKCTQWGGNRFMLKFIVGGICCGLQCTHMIHYFTASCSTFFLSSFILLGSVSISSGLYGCGLFYICHLSIFYVIRVRKDKSYSFLLCFMSSILKPTQHSYLLCNTCSPQTVEIWTPLSSSWPVKLLPLFAKLLVLYPPELLSLKLSAHGCIAALPAAATEGRKASINLLNTTGNLQNDISVSINSAWYLGSVHWFSAIDFVDGLLQQIVCPSQVSHERNKPLKNIYRHMMHWGTFEVYREHRIQYHHVDVP